MKRFLPILIAAGVFIVALVLIRPEATQKVVVLTRDVPAGTLLTANDLELRDLPQRYLPEDTLTDPAPVVGQALKTDRAAGDVVRQAMLGEAMVLRPDERAIAVPVTDASGLAGLLKPGDPVGVTAVVFDQEADGAFAKVTIENLRVVYVDPRFRAGYKGDSSSSTGANSNVTVVSERKDKGTAVLAVPTTPLLVTYVFSDTTEQRQVNALELLAALTSADNTALTLYVMPRDATAFSSSGLFVPDLVLRPTPTPTPTVTPEGFRPTPAPQATAKP